MPKHGSGREDYFVSSMGDLQIVSIPPALIEQQKAIAAGEQSLQRLKHMGFRKVGEWKLENAELKCCLDAEADSENILYAFVCAGLVVYIGKTVQALKKRMYGYQRPGPTQSTNIKGNRMIRVALGECKLMEIYALPDNGLLYYGGFHVNLAAGLEDALVAELKPLWNKSGI